MAFLAQVAVLVAVLPVLADVADKSGLTVDRMRAALNRLRRRYGL